MVGSPLVKLMSLKDGKHHSAVNLDDLDKFEKAAQSNTSESFLAEIAIGHTGKKKLVHYDSELLLKSGAIGTMFCEGTIFVQDMQIYIIMFEYFVFSAIVLALYYVSGPTASDAETGGVIKALSQLSGALRNLTPFVFGLFVSLTLARWWSMRIGSLGVILDGIIFDTMFVCGMGSRRRHHLNWTDEQHNDYEDDVARIYKLGVASMMCITAHSRGDLGMETLVENELLTRDEADDLADCPNKAQVLWSWIGTIGTDLLNRLGVAPPNHNVFYMQSKQSTNAITALEAYYDSQLPLPYVHIIILLVTMNNLLMCLDTSMKMGLALHQGKTHIFAILAVDLVLVPLLYQAMLFICFQVEDPLGDDITDFPIIAFQAGSYRASRAVVKATEVFWDIREKRGLYKG